MSAAAASLWMLGRKVLDCSRPRVMAVLNATPDSFHSASRLAHDPALLGEELAALLEAGPDLVDIGGQSTRPGSERVDPQEEARRVIPVIRALRGLAPELPVTIDTYHSQVAREALAAGADGVNDVSFGRLDPALLDVVAEGGCGYVLMHMQGTPDTMQQAPHYEDCLEEVARFLESGLRALSSRGIALERIVLDPGIGFGKRLADNLALIRGAGRLQQLARPLLYGVSRKGFLGAIGPAADSAERLPGTLGVTWELLNQGVMLHRLHDVREARQLFRVYEALHPISDM